MAPTIFIVPGIYEGPEPFGSLADKLKSSGFDVHVTHLLSTGTSSPGNPSMDDDVAFIASELSQVVDRAGPDGVVAVMHSAGGFLGSMALKGLSAKARAEAGKPGGVRRIVFLTAGVAPEGAEHKPQPFMEFHDDEGYHIVRDARNAFFHDLPEKDAQYWLPKVSRQPAKGWDSTISYCGWREVPNVYIICEADRVLPAPLQEQLASLTGPEEIIRLEDAGHMAQLSKTDEVAEIIVSQAKKLG